MRWASQRSFKVASFLSVRITRLIGPVGQVARCTLWLPVGDLIGLRTQAKVIDIHQGLICGLGEIERTVARGRPPPLP